jgi:hypothetical protein
LMQKRGSALLLGILLVVFGFAAWVLIQEFQGEDTLLDQAREAALPDPEELGKFGVEDTDFGEGRGLQFYGRMRYRSSTIPYWIDESCSLDKQRDIIEAFRTVEGETVLEFIPNKQGAEIRVLCAELAEEKGRQKHILAGEGGPSAIINTSRYGVIFEGQISLYRDEKCDTPQVAIHELLHALGFDHNDDKGSVMYPVTSCSQEIDGAILSEIGVLYAEPERADLVMESVEAWKQGGYVHFNVTVSNQGLADVVEATLVLEGDGEVVQEFSLGDVQIGASRLLHAQWIQVDRRVDGLQFSVTGGVEELEDGNNVVVVSVGKG